MYIYKRIREQYQFSSVTIFLPLNTFTVCSDQNAKVKFLKDSLTSNNLEPEKKFICVRYFLWFPTQRMCVGNRKGFVFFIKGRKKVYGIVLFFFLLIIFQKYLCSWNFFQMFRHKLLLYIFTTLLFDYLNIWGIGGSVIHYRELINEIVRKISLLFWVTISFFVEYVFKCSIL